MRMYKLSFLITAGYKYPKTRKARRFRRFVFFRHKNKKYAVKKYKYKKKLKIPFFRKKKVVIRKKQSHGLLKVKRRFWRKNYKKRFYSFAFGSGVLVSKTLLRLRLKKIRKKFKVRRKSKVSQGLQLVKHLNKSHNLAFLSQVLTGNSDTSNVFFTSSWVWLRYIQNLTYMYTKFYTSWCFLGLHNIATTDEFYRWWRLFYRRYLLRVFFTNKAKFFNWFAQLSFLKDPQGIIWLAEQVLSEAHLKKHKRLFALLARILRNWYKIMRRTHRAKGISIFFKGKLGKKGSVKKSTFFNKIGLVSLSRKDLRFNYRTFIISTHTGVIGANISVFFNGYVYIRNNVCIILYHSSSTYTSIFSNFSFSKKSYAVYLRSNLTRYFSICSKFLNLQTNTVPISRITTCFYFFFKVYICCRHTKICHFVCSGISIFKFFIRHVFLFTNFCDNQQNLRNPDSAPFYIRKQNFFNPKIYGSQ